MPTNKQTVATDDGVEIETDDPDMIIDRPFDPERLKVTTKPLLISQLVARIEHDEIELSPDFQRNMGLWPHQKQTRLIESILLRIPLPVFYVAADTKDNWSVVDGLQRMSTIADFVNGKFALSNLEFLQQFKGLVFSELPRMMQRRIYETSLLVHVIEPGTPEEVMFNIFNRINTGGVPLNAQEVRHALYKGPARNYLLELASSKAFLRATCGTVGTKRMADRECVLRFVAFFGSNWESYNEYDFNSFLGGTMKKINNMSNIERESVSLEFEKAMNAATNIFDNDAFRKRYHPHAGRSVISKALFETWSVGLANCTNSEIKHLITKKLDIRSSFIDLLNHDREFEISISASTGAPQRVRKRFLAIKDLIGVYV